MSALCSKGFKVSNSDHKRLRFCIDGAETKITTKLSHGSGSDELSAELIKRMSKQLHIKKEEFLKFIECTLSQEEYTEKIKHVVWK
ncbi:MAG: hypothetical protein FWD37_03335 [Methanomassiliicoccaceae archaeon]|nr:hypothetical protein [Methanomassiliicoccaceae archaeon]